MEIGTKNLVRLWCAFFFSPTARRKKWDLQEVKVHLDHYKDYAEDMSNAEDNQSKIDHFDRVIEMEGELDDAQKKRLLEIANKCPVHRTLHSDVVVNTSLQEGNLKS